MLRTIHFCWVVLLVSQWFTQRQCDAQDVSWQWTWQHLAHNGREEATALAMDSRDNILLAGATDSILDGRQKSGSKTGHDDDVFLMKIDSSGRVKWTKQRGSPEYDTSNWARGSKAVCVALDSEDNAFLAASTFGDVDGNTNAGHKDIFLMKFDSSGSWLWTRQRGSSEDNTVYAIALDSKGNALLAGRTHGALDGNAHAGAIDIFLMKFDSSGSWLWTRQRGSSMDDTVYALAIDNRDNALLAGSTAGSLDGNTHTCAEDTILVKFDSQGCWQWTRQRGSGFHKDLLCVDRAYALALDFEGNAYLTGFTQSSLDGSSFAGNTDIFVMKYDSSGNWQWTRQRGSPGEDTAYAIAVDSHSNVFLTGSTRGSLDGNDNAGSLDVFLMKIDHEGDWQWTMQRGSSRSDEAFALALDSRSNVFLAGSTEGGLDDEVHAGQYDVFIMKFKKAQGTSTANNTTDPTERTGVIGISSTTLTTIMTGASAGTSKTPFAVSQKICPEIPRTTTTKTATSHTHHNDYQGYQQPPRFKGLQSDTTASEAAQIIAFLKTAVVFVSALLV